MLRDRSRQVRRIHVAFPASAAALAAVQPSLAVIPAEVVAAVAPEGALVRDGVGVGELLATERAGEADVGSAGLVVAVAVSSYRTLKEV